MMKKIYILTEGQKPILNKINESGKFNVPSNEEIEWAYELIEKNIDPAKHNSGRTFVIDVSGKKQMYYTFWVITPKNKNPINYLGNLSLDFKSAVEKAIQKSNGFNLILDRESTVTSKYYATHFTFGKYKGVSVDEVYIENPQYFKWLKDEDLKKGFLKGDIKNEIYKLADLYIDTQTKKNLETSASKHSHQIGDKVNLNLQIYAYKPHIIQTTKIHEAVDYITFYLSDSSDNKYIIYNLQEKMAALGEGGVELSRIFQLAKDMSSSQISDQKKWFSEKIAPFLNNPINVTAKVKANKTYMGVNFTVLNYVKLDAK